MGNINHYLLIFYKKHNLILLLIILLLSLITKLSITTWGYHVDLFSISPWGVWIYENGAYGFYESSGWILSSPTQPPLVNIIYGLSYNLYQLLNFLFVQISTTIALYRLAPTYMIWWFDFVKWFGTATLPVSEILIGHLITIKLIAILADLVIAFIIYHLAKSYHSSKAVFWGLIYLISPLSWYLSSLWGQWDQLSFLFLLTSILCLNRNFIILAPLMLLISLELKPTSLIFVPFFAWIYLKADSSVLQKTVGVLISIGLFIITLSFFTNGNQINYLKDQLYPLIFLKSEYRVTNNSFNFWHILIGNQAMNQNQPFLFIPAKIWGYLAFLVLNLIAFALTVKLSIKNVFFGMFVIGFGSWMFLNNMSERYLFAGVVFGLIATIYKPELLKTWFIMSLVFWINLFHGWWFPQSLSILQQLLIWQSGFLPRILSFVNLAVFLYSMKILLADSEVFKKFPLKLFNRI